MKPEDDVWYEVWCEAEGIELPKVKIRSDKNINISLSLTGKKQPNVSAALKGKKQPNVSAALTGKKQPNVSAALKGKKRTAEHAANISKPCTIDGINLYSSLKAMSKHLGSGKNGGRSPTFRYIPKDMHGCWNFIA